MQGITKMLMAGLLVAGAGTLGWVDSSSAAAGGLQGWATLRGQVVFDGTPPTPAPLKVEKDTDHCLSKGPVPNETWTVDPATKGVRYAVVFLKPAAGQSLPIHDELRAVPAEPLAMDQPECRFEPRVLALRAGQKFVAKNSSPITHNVVLSGLSNTANVTTPAGGTHTFTPDYEPGPIGISCGAHPWMRGFVWVFKHPYFAVTDAQGRFEIKLAPSGPRQLVVWHEAGGFVPNKVGKTIDVPSTGELDLGQIKIK
jgi:plastocyanin